MLRLPGGDVKDDYDSTRKTQRRHGFLDDTSLDTTKRTRTASGAAAPVRDDDGIRVGPGAGTGASAGAGTGTTSSGYTSSFDRRAASGFAGLANQGATCYMNSLLQALFMTPEFRRAMYSWQHNPERDDEPADCIPWQLQRLFGLLQLTERRAIETKDLTTSFGWNSADSFTQNDVQEMCRVLFDAIERSLQNTTDANMINSLFTVRAHC